MNKASIRHQLKKNHELFIDYILNLNESDFLFTKDGKWSAGQQFDHIYLSVEPLAKAMGLPKFVLKLALGKSNRPSKSFDDLVQKYKSKIEEGGKAPKAFEPKVIPFQQRKKIEKKLRSVVKKMLKNLDKFSEEDLDRMIAPHPLLGKLTLREMLYFTMYHVEYHHASVQKLVQK